MTMTDPYTEARFAEQIAGDFPDQPISLPAGVTYVRHSLASPLVTTLWLTQGQPRRRAVILDVGQAWLAADGWHVHGWDMDGSYCPGIPAVELETVGELSVVRAYGGWHLPDLWRLSQVARSPWDFQVRDLW